MVAEIGARFVCADLGLPSELHDSHASYFASWLGIPRADKKAIFHAAAMAEQAFAYLRGFAAALPHLRTLALRLELNGLRHRCKVQTNSA